DCFGSPTTNNAPGRSGTVRQSTDSVSAPLKRGPTRGPTYASAPLKRGPTGSAYADGSVRPAPTVRLKPDSAREPTEDTVGDATESSAASRKTISAWTGSVSWNSSTNRCRYFRC